LIQVLVLGSAAGGGFPQWNSNAPACRRARAGDPAAEPRTQSSLAISCDGASWFLLNASPDLRSQIEHNRALHPRAGLRSSPIAGVVLTNADVDHVAGLLTLREGHPFVLYATARVHAVLRANSIFSVLDPATVRRVEVELERPFALRSADDREAGMSVEMFAVPGKVPLYLETTAAPAAGDTVGLRISEEGNPGPAFFYIPGCAAVTAELARRVEGAALLFFDGTLWQDDELVRAGIGYKTGRRMGHISIAGAGGTLAAFAPLAIGRKILIHLNNSNPVLLADSAERAQVAAAGWEVARDGMEIVL
jgi:pyrroloquinoline quinone biosynthesis protein B